MIINHDALVLSVIICWSDAAELDRDRVQGIDYVNFYETHFFYFRTNLTWKVDEENDWNSLSNDIKLSDYVRKLWESEIRCKEVKKKWDHKANLHHSS